MAHNDELETEKFWNKLKDSDRRNFTILASSQGKGEIESDDGVVSGHAYSVISVHEF